MESIKASFSSTDLSSVIDAYARHEWKKMRARSPDQTDLSILNHPLDESGLNCRQVPNESENQIGSPVAASTPKVSSAEIENLCELKIVEDVGPSETPRNHRQVPAQVYTRRAQCSRLHKYESEPLARKLDFCELDD